MNPVYCRHCKASIQSQDIFCRSCGADQRASPQPTRRFPDTVDQSALPATFDCIVCGNAGVQKVSALYQAGAWSATATGNFGGYAYDGQGQTAAFAGRTTSNSAGMTGLARLLAPPAKPSLYLPATVAIWSLLVFLLIGCLLFTSAYSGSGDMHLVEGFALAGVLLLAVPAWKANDQYKRRMSESTRSWEQSCHRWNALFYCSRCDHVYNPQTRQSAPSQAMTSLL